MENPPLGGKTKSSPTPKFGGNTSLQPTREELADALLGFRSE